MNRMIWRLLLNGLLGFLVTACQPLSPAQKDGDDSEGTPRPTNTPRSLITSAAKTPGVHEQFLSPDNLRYTIAIPEGYSEENPVPLVLALHYGGPVTPFYGKGFLLGLVEPALRELGAIMVAPDSAAGSWANPQAEANVLALMDAIQATYNIDPKRTLITGFSLGGMGTWYLAARHPDRFAVAVPMAGRPESESADVDWAIPLYAIHGGQDELIPLAPTENVVSQLESRGVNVKLVVLEGVTHYETHRFVEPLKASIPWIKEAWR